MNSVISFALGALLVGQPAQSTFVLPNFPDTTIKTRVTHGLQPPIVTILRLKGPRTRSESEHTSNNSSGAFLTRISQCDRKAWISLNNTTKTYRISLIHEPDENARERMERLQAESHKPAGPVVTVITDSQATGEQRQMGIFEARHIKTTITVEPGPDARTAASRMEVDGWYIDLPGLNCRSAERGNQPPFSGWLVLTAVGERGNFKFVKTGNATVGYAVEETSTVRSEGNVVVNKTELVEFSDKPLDDSLFEIPANYTEAPQPLMQRSAPLPGAASH